MSRLYKVPVMGKRTRTGGIVYKAKQEKVVLLVMALVVFIALAAAVMAVA